MFYLVKECILHYINFYQVYCMHLLYCIYSNVQIKFIHVLFFFFSILITCIYIYVYMYTYTYIYTKLISCIFVSLSIISYCSFNHKCNYFIAYSIRFSKAFFFYSFVYYCYYILLQYIIQIQYITFEMHFVIFVMYVFY